MESNVIPLATHRQDACATTLLVAESGILLPKAAAAAGIDYAGLCQRMVDLALARKTAAELKAEQELAGSTVIMTMINVV